MYDYRAKCVAVYDADTITCDVDLGFKQHSKGIKFRLFGIDAPEMRGAEKAEGKVSRDYVRERILGKEVRLVTYKDKTGKYGRWLADVYPLENDGTTLNRELVQKGLAVEANY